jgi:PAS domain S-box-containing protein
MSKSLKEQIKGLEERSRLITENLIDAVWVVNSETLKFEYITPSIEKISGYAADEWIGSHISVFMDPESFNESIAIMEKEMKEFRRGKKNIRTMELKFIHKNGDAFWAELRATLIKERGKQLKVVGITRDITEKKRAELQQENINIKLAKALEDKEKLLQDIKVLEGLLPICSGCKRIRDESGRWWPLDVYVKNRTDAEITHTICSDCKDVLYSDL